MIKGIDVSTHNGTINWQAVKDSGIKFAMIRIGIGSDIASQDDQRAAYNIKECTRLGIDFGLYIYSYALTEQDAHSEAAHMLRFLKTCKPTLGAYIDMEDADGYKAKHSFKPLERRTELTDFCLIFMDDLKKAGYKDVGVYASYDYFKNVLDTAKLRKQGKIWLAHWGINEPSLPCEIWQYSSDGTVAGITGRVDINFYYGAGIETDTSEYYQKYIGNTVSIVAALQSLCVDSNFSFRQKIAVKNNVTGYKGTAEQNTYLLDLLKKGKLKKV